MAIGCIKQTKIKRQEPKVSFFMPPLFVFPFDLPLGPERQVTFIPTVF